MPINLNIIKETPEKYFNLLRKHPVKYVTFQYEQLKKKLEIPANIKGEKGLALSPQLQCLHLMIMLHMILCFLWRLSLDKVVAFLTLKILGKYVNSKRSIQIKMCMLMVE